MNLRRILVFSSLLVAPSAWSAPLKAQLKRTGSGAAIAGLDLVGTEYEIVWDELAADTPVPVLKLEAPVQVKDRTFFFEHDRIRPFLQAARGDQAAVSLLRLRIPIREPQQVLRFSVIDITGEVIEAPHQLVLSKETWAQIQSEISDWAQSENKPILFRSSVSIGVTRLTYTEAPSDSLMEWVSTFKASFEAAFREKPWAASLSGFGNVLPLGSSVVNRSMQVVGLNARVGFRLPWPQSFKDKLELWMWAGWYYTTSFVTNNAFGYRDMMGPQLFPQVRWRVSSRDTLSAYFKASPVTENFGLDFANWEIAGGVSWARPIARIKRKPLSILAALDASRISGALQRVIPFEGLSLSLSAGLALQF